METIDCVVIGAGVVGLATARALALQGREVLVLEAANAIGTRASSRNSEVIHAGIYYAPGSLKARFCVQGKGMLYAYCAERGVAYKRCGKLIVATTEAQIAQLEATRVRAVANGVHDLVLLTGDEARALEPHLACEAALHSPGTGIIDSHAYMLGLQGDLENAGGVVVLNTAIAQAECAQAAIILVADDGTELAAKCVVNAAGAHAQGLAKCFVGLVPALVPPSHFCKGNYFTLSKRAPFSRLIYPVPEAAGLGVHLTLDLGGQARFGPVVDASRSAAFYAEVRKYWPALADGALVPDYAGIRPKIQAPGEPARDFLIQGPFEHGVPGLVNLFGIESPGLTSSLAIGAYVSQLLTR